MKKRKDTYPIAIAVTLFLGIIIGYCVRDSIITGATVFDCDGMNYCDSACPEYDMCACDPGMCGPACDGSMVCDSACPEYDMCACDPESESCQVAMGPGEDTGVA